MIQPNPTKRIKVHDIKVHPWLRKSLPIYAKLPTLVPNVPIRPAEIDMAILAKVKGYGMESLSRNIDEERIKRILRGRLDASFVTAYELLKDSKKEKERKLSLSVHTGDNSGLILDSVANYLDK